MPKVVADRPAWLTGQGSFCLPAIVFPRAVSSQYFVTEGGVSMGLLSVSIDGGKQKQCKVATYKKGIENLSVGRRGTQDTSSPAKCAANG
jgi:hypothetical protein